MALGFLIGATVIFLVCRWAQARGGLAAPAWIGYVRAAAEAGMVGALADWFAVTALFRHPLGLPIPHTAIIKRKKDQLGEGLGTFVRENFLSADVVETKLRDAEVAGRLGKWLSDPATPPGWPRRPPTVLRVVVEIAATTTTSSRSSTARSSSASPNRSGVRRRAGCWRVCSPRTVRKP